MKGGIFASPTLEEFDAHMAEVEAAKASAKPRGKHWRTHERSIRKIRQFAVERSLGRTSKDYWQQVASTAAVDDIIRATIRTPGKGTSPLVVGAWLNKRRLRLDIERAYSLYQIHQMADNKQVGRGARSRLKAIAKNAAALIECLEASDADVANYLQVLLVPQFPAYEGGLDGMQDIPDTEIASPSFHSLKAGVRRLGRMAEVLLGETDEGEPLIADSSLLPLPNNAGEALVGKYLASVFEKWFDEPASAGSRSTVEGDYLEADSPYIRFVQAVLADLRARKIEMTEYSNEAIALYRKNGKANRSRRKGRG